MTQSTAVVPMGTFNVNDLTSDSEKSCSEIIISVDDSEMKCSEKKDMKIVLDDKGTFLHLK